MISIIKKIWRNLGEMLKKTRANVEEIIKFQDFFHISFAFLPSFLKISYKNFFEESMDKLDKSSPFHRNFFLWDLQYLP